MKVQNNSISLLLAIKADDIETVKILIQNGVDVNGLILDHPMIPLRYRKATPLHAAAHYGRLDVIKIFAAHGVNVNPILEGGKIHGFTPLHLAVQKNHLECVKLLLELGASVIPQTEGIYHPIHYAVFNNFVDVARELLQHGADANVRFNNNFFKHNRVTMERSLWLDHDLPLFHYSILQDYLAMIDELFDYTDVNLKTSLGKTTLMQAVEVNNFCWVGDLVTKENVNDRDNFGQPVLHFTMVNAVRKRSMYSKGEYSFTENLKLSVVKILVKNGADANARFPENDKYGCIIHYMIKYGFSEGVKYLLFENTDLNINVIDTFTICTAHVIHKNLTPDIISDRAFISKLVTRFHQSRLYIAQKLIDLQMIGQPVDQNLILCLPNNLRTREEKYKEYIDLYRIKVMLEVNYMKETKVGDTNVTILDLLTCDMDKLVKFMSNESVRNFCIFDHRRKVTRYYYYALNERLSWAKSKKLFLEESTELLFSSCTPALDFDCCENIVSFL